MAWNSGSFCYSVPNPEHTACLGFYFRWESCFMIRSPCVLGLSAGSHLSPWLLPVTLVCCLVPPLGAFIRFGLNSLSLKRLVNESPFEVTVYPLIVCSWFSFSLVFSTVAFWFPCCPVFIYIFPTFLFLSPFPSFF